MSGDEAAARRRSPEAEGSPSPVRGRQTRPRANSVGPNSARPTSRAAAPRAPFAEEAEPQEAERPDVPSPAPKQFPAPAPEGQSQEVPASFLATPTFLARLSIALGVVVAAVCLALLLPDDDASPCGSLASPENAQCRRDVEWAFAQGRFEPWGPDKYGAIVAIGGVSLLDATQDDFQRLFFCESWPEYRCATAPCTCSKPPCHTCGPVEQRPKPTRIEPRAMQPQPEEATYAEMHLIKGIGYAPAPVKHQHQLPNDDFMCDSARPMWASHPQGRGDLALIQKLGADTVRLYGSDPNQPHRAFLDEAHRHNLKIIAGTSDYPFLQMPGNCRDTGFDCYEQLKNWHAAALQSGYADGRSYHPSLSTLIVINELDIKIGINNPKAYMKAIISAIDGVVDAEREAGVTQKLPRLSATFSFAVCTTCSSFSSKPALGQMHELRTAMRDPMSYGYSPRNDLSQVYERRVIHSFNTFNAAEEIRPLFLDVYDEHFQGTPVFIGEFHPPVKQAADLQLVQELVHARENSMLVGVVFFEFQRRYDKSSGDGFGAEREQSFGMFELGNEAVTNIDYFGLGPSVWCLVPSGRLQDAVSTAFKGSTLSGSELCGAGRQAL